MKHIFFELCVHLGFLLCRIGCRVTKCAYIGVYQEGIFYSFKKEDITMKITPKLDYLIVDGETIRREDPRFIELEKKYCKEYEIKEVDSDESKDC